MLIKTDAYEPIAAALKAVAHPVRISIILLLTEREEMSVTEITEALDREQATVSQHLQKMKLFGFLCTRREGKFVQYSLKKDQLIDLIKVSQGLVA